MPRYFAFLRAINVGGHNVKMEALRNAFVAMGFGGVETFIASGNVIFSSRSSGRVLEGMIETGLRETLGYEVKTFLRNDAELTGIAKHPAFPEADVLAAHAVYVGFLAHPLSPAGEAALASFRTEIDDFHARGREVYWKCLTRQTESTFSSAALERTLKIAATWRNSNTIQRLAAKYGL